MDEKTINEEMLQDVEKHFDEATAQNTLESGYAQAEEMLKDQDKMERFLQRLEHKLKVIPIAGEKLADVPIMASLIRSYVKKEYTDIPIGTVMAIISALIYFVSPIDIVPDSVPVLGYFDDAAVVAACWKLVDSDVTEYIKWRKENGKEIEL